MAIWILSGLPSDTSLCNAGSKTQPYSQQVMTPVDDTLFATNPVLLIIVAAGD